VSRAMCASGSAWPVTLAAMKNPDDLDTYLPVNATCARFGLSRSTLYKMLRDHPELEAEGVVFRVPPCTGRLRIAFRAFQTWLVRAGSRAA
jgi:hypothetical protein